MNKSNPPYLKSDESISESKVRIQIKYRPIDYDTWIFFRAFEAVGTIALSQFGQGLGIPLTARVKYDWEIRRNGLAFPQTSPNIGPYGIIPIDTYIAIMELVREGYYDLEWRRTIKGKGESSYSNFEYTGHRSRRIYPTHKVEELRAFLDEKLNASELIKNIKILATRLGLGPIGLAERSKRTLVTIAKSGYMPYSYLGNDPGGKQTNFSDIINRVDKVRGEYQKSFGSIDLPSSPVSEVNRCRKACLSIIHQKEDERSKSSLFLPELVRRWKRGDRYFVGDKVLYAGRFIETPRAVGEGLFKTDFSTSLYLKGSALQCTVYLHRKGFDLSKMSPLGLSENIFLLLGTVNGETDQRKRPIITANALILVDDLQPHVPRLPLKSLDYIA